LPITAAPVVNVVTKPIFIGSVARAGGAERAKIVAIPARLNPENLLGRIENPPV
jgi:hypothetical protein